MRDTGFAIAQHILLYFSRRGFRQFIHKRDPLRDLKVRQSFSDMKFYFVRRYFRICLFNHKGMGGLSPFFMWHPHYRDLLH